MPGFVVLLLVLLIASIPIWPYNPDWGFRPAGVLAVALVLMLLAWWFLGRGHALSAPSRGFTSRPTTTALG